MFRSFFMFSGPLIVGVVILVVSIMQQPLRRDLYEVSRFYGTALHGVPARRFKEGPVTLAIYDSRARRPARPAH
jgi:hypothetical protein